MGFLLRSATANGISLHGLRDLCGLSSVRTLWGNDAPSLTGVLNVPLSELQAILIDKGRHMDAPAYQIDGRIILRAELLRLGRPQVCVICVHRQGYCRAMWDCQLYTVCHIHRTPMVELCKACGGALRWYRLAVDVCHCGAYFQPLGELGADVSDADLWVANRIAKYFGDDPSGNSVSKAMPDWINELSFDGFLSLILAFGIRVTSHQRVSRIGRAKMPRAFLRNVCTRAVQRLEDYSGGANAGLLAPWIWEGGLESLALSHVQRADQQVALRLLREVFDTEIAARFGSERAALCQMSLFEE
jgi:hypothetical protein